jgi:non-heme chloroperoxidase
MNSAEPPLMLKTAANPNGLLIEVFDGIRPDSIADRSQFKANLFKKRSLPENLE